MLDDLERLDSLINHLLDAARIGREPAETPPEDVELSQLLGSIARASCQQYHLSDDAVELRSPPVTMTARPTDLEMIFRNLIDNALKYSGPQPKVEVNVTSNNGRVTTRIADNGPGIPINLRRKIFGRFVRLGSELERKQAHGAGSIYRPPARSPDARQDHGARPGEPKRDRV
jgi:signal transduction histidine kinase